MNFWQIENSHNSFHFRFWPEQKNLFFSQNGADRFCASNFKISGCPRAPSNHCKTLGLGHWAPKFCHREGQNFAGGYTAHVETNSTM